MIKLPFFIFLLFTSSEAFSAACCGGGSVLPALITGDDRIQLSGTYSSQTNASYVSPQGQWQHLTDGDTTTILKLDAATLLADKWQLGLSTPVSSRTVGVSSSPYALGDATADVAYEFLPEWEYSSFKPKGYTFFQLTAPTGKSIYESTDPLGSDITGRGFFSAALGAFFVKIKPPWDFNLAFDLHKSFDRQISSSLGIYNLHPGFGEDVTLGAGFNLKNTRLGTFLNFLYEDSIDTSSNTDISGISSVGSFQRVVTAGLMVSYLLSDQLSGALIYSDQSLFGNPVNSFLGRTISVSFQQRFPR